MTALQIQLEDFSRAKTVPSLIELGQPFLKTAAAAKAAKNDAFRDGLTELTNCFSFGESELQLLAVAFAWRVTSVTSMREHRRYVIKRLREPSAEPSCLPTIMSDPDDRKNLAEALRWKEDGWVASYLCKSIVHEKDGKQARTTSCESLLLKQPDLGLSLETLADELRKLRLAQKDENLGRARQLNNILIALTEAVWNAPNDFEVGDNFGSAYSKFVSSVVDKGDISDRSVKIDLAKSVVEFYVTLARLQPTLLADSTSYSFIKVIKRLFTPADWPLEFEPTINILAKQLSGQLVFMLRLDRPDKDLRSLLLFMKGEVSGKAWLKKLAVSARGLSDDYRYWLEFGRGRKTLVTEAAVAGSALSQFDLDLAYLFRSIDVAADLTPGTLSAFENEADLLPASTSARVKRAFAKYSDISELAKQLARSRELSTRGNIGEIVEFDPSEHEPNADAVGEKTVRLVTKIIERKLSSNQKVVVLKAEVEKT